MTRRKVTPGGGGGKRRAAQGSGGRSGDLLRRARAIDIGVGRAADKNAAARLATPRAHRRAPAQR